MSFWYRFWSSFCHFWAPKELEIDLKILPKCSQKSATNWVNRFCLSTWSQNAPKWLQELKKWPFWMPKRPPRAPKLTSEPSQDLKIDTRMRPELKLCTFYNILTRHTIRQHNWHFTPHTSDNTRPTWHVALQTLHFTLCTSHFLHVTQYGPAVCAKRLNNHQFLFSHFDRV